MTEKFNLTWHTFQIHTNELLSDLYTSSQFSDVTLICDDQTHFQVHKFVLSSCSSVFRNILSQNSQLPCIYIRGIEKEEMESILQFMYLGEATFYQERMNKFLDVAKDLDLKEIGKSVDLDEGQNTVPDDNNIDDTPVIIDNSRDYDDLNTVLKVNENDKYSCDKCESAFITYSGLYLHKKSKHEGVKYPCQQCDFKATQVGHLNQHVKSKHEGMNYPCQQCEYKATSTSNLSQHIKSKHEGAKYPCK